MTKMFLARIVLICCLLLLTGTVFAQDNAMPDLVNLDHLKFLTESAVVDGQETAIVHIYSEVPDYQWVDAAGEGISCVDDVARAAVVYLWQYERTGEAELLDYARQSLNFVLYMQVDDGEFYNFIYDREGTINRTGNTSYKSLGWWAMRGLWALGEGVRVFDEIDPAYADQLAEAYLKTEAALINTVNNYGTTIPIHGFDVPAWIPGGEPAVASIGLLGLANYYMARPNDTTADLITRIADGVAVYRLGDDSTYPFGMHPVRTNTPGFWHAWGAHSTHALVVAGMAMDRQDWIDSAAASAKSFLLRQITLERFRRIGVIPNRLEQIAYGTNMIVQTYMALYRATGDEEYARLGGLAASWYFHNNMTGVQMYYPENGRVFDGMNGPVAWRINRNSGAESTIEGLMSMLVVADVPEAMDMLYVEPEPFTSYTVLEAEKGDRINGTPVYYPGTWTGEGYISDGRYIGLGEGQRMRIKFDIEREDDYLLYVAHMHQPSSSDSNTIPWTDAAPVIDGDFSDWPVDVPELASNTQRQLLRGGGVWQGADVDSHAIRLLWDTDNLYIQAHVRDPEHDQPYTLRTVWQGDTLWFYMTNDPDVRTLSAKFTLAQTPDGPQVWDWIGTGFVEGAQMAFIPGEGGYVYEASVPWAALDVDAPEAGQAIGLEVGRGIGGNSFMDLTGRDPDVASNLLKLVLTKPGVETGSDTVPEVYLDVRLDTLDTVSIPQMVSPDSDYFWLDLVTPQPVQLEAGEHTIRYGYGGPESENPGLAKVDAFYLQPAVARRTFIHPDGHTITLSYNTLTGEIAWE